MAQQQRADLGVAHGFAHLELAEIIGQHAAEVFLDVGVFAFGERGIEGEGGGDLHEDRRGRAAAQHDAGRAHVFETNPHLFEQIGRNVPVAQDHFHLAGPPAGVFNHLHLVDAKAAGGLLQRRHGAGVGGLHQPAGAGAAEFGDLDARLVDAPLDLVGIGL